MGSWADSFFGIRSPLQLPVELFDGYQGNQSAMIAALPGLCSGATINRGEWITSVALAGNQMDDTNRRSVERQFPELSGGYHLPRFGRVVDAPGLCDDFQLRIGVNVELLLPVSKPDPVLPTAFGTVLWGTTETCSVGISLNAHCSRLSYKSKIENSDG